MQRWHSGCSIPPHGYPLRVSGPTAAATTIKAFVEEFPDGHLVVAVGFASVSGIAWLSRHAAHSTITLLIGDTRQQHLAAAVARPEDREEAARFLRRPDVRVLNWYRSGRGAQPRRSAHLKVWAVLERDSVTRRVKPDPTAMLVGSANLTLAGLLYNEEAFARAGREDARQIAGQLERLTREGWDCRHRLVEAISGAESRRARVEERSPPSPGTWSSRSGADSRRARVEERREPVPARRPGCLFALLMPWTLLKRTVTPGDPPDIGRVGGWADGVDLPAPGGAPSSGGF